MYEYRAGQGKGRAGTQRQREKEGHRERRGKGEERKPELDREKGTWVEKASKGGKELDSHSRRHSRGGKGAQMERRLLWQAEVGEGNSDLHELLCIWLAFSRSERRGDFSKR